MFLIVLTFATDSDRQKFEFLYEKYKKLLLHKTYEILHDYMLAEDAVSEAYMRVYRNLHKIDDPASNRSAAFLVTIARNVALTMVKKTGDVQDSDERPEQADSFDLEQVVLSSIASADVYRVVESLEDELRTVFVMKYAYDMANKEIAATLNIRENNVAVRLHRAKKKLSEILVKEGYAYETK